MGRKHTLTVKGRYAHIDQVCDFLVDGARQAGFDDNAQFQMRLACDEACTNIIEHAYGGEGNGKITASWQLDSVYFVITFFDKGKPFDPDLIPQPHFPTNPDDLDNLKVGGLGLHLMHQVMDDINFDFSRRGTTLTLKKFLPN